MSGMMRKQRCLAQFVEADKNRVLLIGCCQCRSLFDESKMTSNTEFEATKDQSAANAYEEDFM